MSYMVLSLQSLSLFIVKMNEKKYSQIYIPPRFQKYLDEVIFGENDMLRETQQDVGLPSIVARGRSCFSFWEIFLFSSKEEMNKIFTKFENHFPDNLIININLGDMRLFRLIKEKKNQFRRQMKVWFFLEKCSKKLLHLRQNRILFVEQIFEKFSKEMSNLIYFLLPNGKYLAVSSADKSNEFFLWA